MNDTPFDLLYRQLIVDVKATPEWASVLKERNLITFDSQTNPEKRQVQTADLPELVIYMSGLRGNLHASSSTCLLTTTWQYMISSGVFDSSKINALVFGTIRALSNKAELFKLTWTNRAFVRDVRLFNADQGLSNPAANRNIQGFSCLLSAEIDVSLLISDLAL